MPYKNQRLIITEKLKIISQNILRTLDQMKMIESS